jgi:hypothetical protein
MTVPSHVVLLGRELSIANKFGMLLLSKTRHQFLSHDYYPQASFHIQINIGNCFPKR